MKKYIIAALFAFVGLPMMAQTFANSLVMVAPDDEYVYTVAVSGEVLCDSCLSTKNRKWQMNDIYAGVVVVKVVSGDLTVVQKVELAPKKNDLQEPYRATYKIVRKRNKLVLKRHSVVSKVR